MRRMIKAVMFVCFFVTAVYFVQPGRATKGNEAAKPSSKAATGRLASAKAPEIPLPANFQSPCADAKESPLPLPTNVPPSQFVAYEQQILDFLKSGAYRTDLKWCVDKGVRDTGPYLKNVYYGTHPAVRIYYSPGIMKWLTDGREGQIPDGSMIIKEQFEPPSTRYVGMTDAQLPKVTDWTVMIKDDKGSSDGWFWGEFFEGMKFDDDKVPFQYPWAGFGLYCTRCHATAQQEMTFITLDNVKGYPGTPLVFEDDGSWKTHGATSAFSRRHGQPAIPVATTDSTADPDFLKTFDSIKEVARSEVQTMPSETFDHVGSSGVGSPGFLSSSNCLQCHGGLNGPFGPVMFLPSSPRIPGVISGANISPYGEWRWSPMGLAGRDPIFYSQLESELAYVATLPPSVRDQQDKTVRNLCVSCHGVMGKRQFDTDHGAGSDFKLDFLQITDRSDPNFKYGALARDGISCAACHRTLETPTPEGQTKLEYFLNNVITGRFSVGPATRVYGPFEDVKTKPMLNALEIRPQFDQYITTSRVCGGCHTIDLPVIDGTAGQRSIEQATYLEWLNSKYQNEFGPPDTLLTPEMSRASQFPPAFRSCQQCHMPDSYHSKKKGIDVPDLDEKIAIIMDETYPKATFAMDIEDRTIEKNNRFKRHELVGINVFLLEMFSQFWDLLGVRRPIAGTSVGDDYMSGSKTDLDDAIDNMVDQAENHTAAIEVEALAVSQRQIQAELTISNFAGHRFPTGVGFRRVFIEFLVKDKDGNLVWSSGRTNKLGIIVGPDGKTLPSEFHEEYIDGMGRVQQRFEPHYEVVDAQDKVQIYEELTLNGDGKFTTSFIRRNRNPKDNRLLPQGFTLEGPHPSLNGRFLHATYAEGESVEHDPDYTNGQGKDHITYLMTLPAGVDPTTCTVQATLYYQATPPRYLADRFKIAPNGEATKRLYYLASNLSLAGTPIENWKLKIVSTGAQPVAGGVTCDKFCLKAARFYYNRIGGLPRGIVRIAGSSANAQVSTENSLQMRQLLGSTRTIRERFNREFVAFQISMIAASPIGTLTQQSPLSCFGIEFDAITLGDGTRISSATTFEAFTTAIDRVLVGRAPTDMEKLTTVLALLNGNDALGGCGGP